MRFTATKKALRRALSTALRAVGSGIGWPILSKVLLRTLDDSVEVVSKDIGLSLRTSFEARVDREGSAAVEARNLSEVVRGLPDAEAVFDTLSGNRMSIYSAAVGSGASFSLPVTGADRFPSFPAVPESKFVRLKQATLKTMLRKTMFCMSLDPRRHDIHGICFRKEGRSFRLVATDGRRLSTISRIGGFPADRRRDIMVGARTLREVRRLLGDKGVCGIAVHEGSIFFDFGEVRLGSRLVDGGIPDPRSLIPDRKAIELSVRKDRLCAALRRVLRFSGERRGRIAFSLSPGVLSLSCEHAKRGTAREDIAVAYRGPDCQGRFASRFLLDALQEVDGHAVTLAMFGPELPLALRDHGDPCYLYLFMPVLPGDNSPREAEERAVPRIRRQGGRTTLQATVHLHLGLCASPCARIVEKQAEWGRDVQLIREPSLLHGPSLQRLKADTREIMEMMSLAASFGTTMTISVQGTDTRAADIARRIYSALTCEDSYQLDFDKFARRQSK